MLFTVLHNGCDILKCEMEESVEALSSLNMEYSDKQEEAEIVIFFCCSFTLEREISTKKTIERLVKEGKSVIVSGCFLHRFKPLFSNVDFVNRKDLQNYFKSRYNLSSSFVTKQTTIKHACEKKQIINIASGCIGHCTYCSIRQVRGHISSRPILDILQRIEQHKECTQIKLVAHDVSAYGYDIGTSLPNLLHNIWDKYPNLKIELGNLNISFLKNYSKYELELFKSVEGNLNLPIQSASNNVLMKMNRDYVIEDFYWLYENLSSMNCKISTDIIAGFPTETDKDHVLNIRLLKDYYFDFAQIFMFDPRPNTQAAAMSQIDADIKAKRTIELIACFLSTFHEKNHFSYNKMKESQFYNTNLIIN